MYAYLKFKPKLFISECSFRKGNRKESTYPSLQLDCNLLFVGFAYMFKWDLKNARNKFANVILKSKFIITQFNASNLIMLYYNQCCIENKVKNEV